MRLCAAQTRRAWAGSGLRVNARKFKGPSNGYDDSHWYVRRGKDRLHIVDGYAWHAGLPPEEILVRSESISVRDWVFGSIVGLDLSGRTIDGKYWRWVGTPLKSAIEYRDISRESADYFDAIIETACVGSQ